MWSNQVEQFFRLFHCVKCIYIVFMYSAALDDNIVYFMMGLA